MSSSDELKQIFADDSPLDDNSETWKILLADDEPEVHRITELALADFEFDGKPLTFLNAYSGQEAQDLMVEHPDIAIVFLDIIMETDNAGLEVVQYIRNILNNHLVRIIVRTGQPGQFQEDVVALEYDINDYKTKTELTRQKLIAKIITSLRVFRTLVTIEKSKRELERIARESERLGQYLKEYTEQLEATITIQAQELKQTNAQLDRERKERKRIKATLQEIRQQLSALSSKEDFSDDESEKL